MLTGPMHRKPNATRPNAKMEPTPTSLAGLAGSRFTIMTSSSPCRLTKYAPAIRVAMSRPFQNALKFPATMPDRMVSDGPPSRDAVTISWTCLECELVKTLVNSGISTAARVPQLMMVASCHQRFSVLVESTPGTDNPRIKSQLMKNDVLMHRIAAIQMRRVSGSSKLNSVRPAYCRSEIAWLTKYDTPDMKSIKKRIAKIQTMSLA